MRGTDERSGSLFSYVDLEERIPKSHPLRAIREIANAALSELSADFAALYAPLGRPSIAPEKLLRASLLQAFYTIRSERQLMERLEFDLLFRWFVGLGIDDAVWDHSVFSKNRDRLLEGEIAAKFMAAVLTQPKVKQLLSTEHFSVDGTLVEAWASMKSLKPKDGDAGNEPPASGGRNEEVDFRGEKRSNQTHVSATDPDAMLYRKGSGMEARLCFIGHALMENRHGLFIDTRLTRVSGWLKKLERAPSPPDGASSPATLPQRVPPQCGRLPTEAASIREGPIRRLLVAAKCPFPMQTGVRRQAGSRLLARRFVLENRFIHMRGHDIRPETGLVIRLAFDAKRELVQIVAGEHDTRTVPNWPHERMREQLFFGLASAQPSRRPTLEPMFSDLGGARLWLLQ